ncbi:FK506 binding protein [Aureococcus anophagefferens]|nr:FK506 binding protein [Aureococcus anophagefferens]
MRLQKDQRVATIQLPDAGAYGPRCVPPPADGSRRRFKRLCAPSFLIIGFGRCGTTSLARYLNRHQRRSHAAASTSLYRPEFCDLQHGPNNGSACVSAYASQFPVARKEPQRDATFDATPMLGGDMGVARFQDSLEAGTNAMPRKLRQLLLDNCYVDKLEAWLKFFPPERFLLLQSEDLRVETRRQAMLDEVHDFLRLPPHAYPAEDLAELGNFRKFTNTTVSPALRSTARLRAAIAPGAAPLDWSKPDRDVTFDATPMLGGDMGARAGVPTFESLAQILRDNCYVDKLAPWFDAPEDRFLLLDSDDLRGDVPVRQRILDDVHDFLELPAHAYATEDLDLLGNFHLASNATVLPLLRRTVNCRRSSRELVVGTTMMGQATEADTYRTVEFQRDGVAVACGGTYEPGATYAATMSPLPPGGGGVLFDLSGGVFDDDWCDGARSAKSYTYLAAPTDGSAMALVGGWSAGYGRVRITDACELAAPAAPSPTPEPAPAPTAAPTVAPTACSDAPDFHKKNAPAKDCAWVAKVPEDRCAAKGDETQAWQSCPATCDTCPYECAGDSASWHKKSDAAKDCGWVTGYYYNRASVIGEDGSMAFESCPSATRRCFYEGYRDSDTWAKKDQPWTARGRRGGERCVAAATAPRRRIVPIRLPDRLVQTVDVEANEIKETPALDVAAPPKRTKLNLGWIVALNVLLAFAEISYDKRDYDRERLPFGYARATTVGALVNVAALEALCLSIALSALCKFYRPDAVSDLRALLIVSAVGAVVNIASALMACCGVEGAHVHVGGGVCDGNHAPVAGAGRWASIGRMACADGCCAAAPPPPTLQTLAFQAPMQRGAKRPPSFRALPSAGGGAPPSPSAPPPGPWASAPRTLLEGAPPPDDKGALRDQLQAALKGRAKVESTALVHLRDPLERCAMVRLEVGDDKAAVRGAGIRIGPSPTPRAACSGASARRHAHVEVNAERGFARASAV